MYALNSGETERQLACALHLIYSACQSHHRFGGAVNESFLEFSS